MSLLSANVATVNRVARCCTRCCTKPARLKKGFHHPRSLRYTTNTTATTTTRLGPLQRGWPFPLGLSLLLLPPLYYYLRSSKPPLNPQTYTDHPISTNTRITPQHTLTTIPLPQESLATFKSEDGVVTVHHVMVKNPDLMIERPYTPVNDVEKDGQVKLVVKRVKGGEVGRMVHLLKEGDVIGLRGPIPTFSLNPFDYSRIVMISTGTAIAPFLQLLSKLPAPISDSSSSTQTQFHLIHSLPLAGREDWAIQPDLLPSLQAKFGDALRVQRVVPGEIPKPNIDEALRGRDEKVLVLVCLPPAMLNPLCGPMSPTLGQGEVTGILRDCGLSSKNVFKLE